MRGIQVSVRITIHTTTGASAQSQTFNTIGGSAISVVETRMNPKIDKIQFKRCTNNNVLDEQGEYISSTINTSLNFIKKPAVPLILHEGRTPGTSHGGWDAFFGASSCYNYYIGFRHFETFLE